MDQRQHPFSGEPPGFDDAREVFDKHSGKLKLVVVLVLLLIVGYKSFYVIGTDEVGVLTRFGRYVTAHEPGPHFKIPFVEKVHKVKAKRQLKQEFGFRTEEAGVKTKYRRDALTLRESMMLTGDLNVAVVEWIVQYRISDPYQFLFKVRNVEETLRDISEATMRAVVGDYSVTEVLTKGREIILDQARQHLSTLCERYETGIAIKGVELRVSAPPEPVKPSFNSVNQAEQERDRLNNEAWSRYNQVIPAARGEAKQVVQEAEGYAIERVNKARGDAERFLAIQKEYAKAPAVTRARLYLETMSEVLPQAGKKVFLDENAKGVIPLLFSEGTANRTILQQTGGVK